MSVEVPYVYLCGPINGCTDEECKDWRKYARDHLFYPTLDPMRRDYRGREHECMKEIVSGDVADIKASKFILANCPKPSYGTAMEIRIAYKEEKKIVVIVVPDIKTVSPWLAMHCTKFFTDVAGAVSWINKFHGDRPNDNL